MSALRDFADRGTLSCSCITVEAGIGAVAQLFIMHMVPGSINSERMAVRESKRAPWPREPFAFPWAGMATQVPATIVLLLVSGYSMLLLYFGGFAGAPLHIHLMQGTGILMMLLFLHLFFGPWRRFGRAVEREAFPEAAKALDQIRRIVAINLVLGLLTVIVGASGRFW